MADQKHKITYELLLREQLTQKAKELNRYIKDLDSNIGSVDSSTKKTSGSISSFGSVLKGVGFALGAKEVLDFAGSIVTAGANIETLETQFRPLLGSTEAAKERIKELVEFSSKTPFQLPGVANASRVLETLTNGTLSTGEGLRLVGDAAAQSGEDFTNLATHVGRAYSALSSNRAAGESLARLQELGLLTGEARNKIEDLQKAAKGKEAWAVLQEELKKSNGAMEQLSETFDGKVSTMKDNWDALLVTISNSGSVLKIAKEGVDLLTESIQWWNEALGGGPEEPAAIKSTKDLISLQKGSAYWEERLAVAREKSNNDAQIKRLEARVQNYKELITQNNEEFKALVKSNAEKKKQAELEKERLKNEKEAQRIRDENAKKAEAFAEKQKALTEKELNTIESLKVDHAERLRLLMFSEDERETIAINDKYKKQIELFEKHKEDTKELIALRDLETKAVERAAEEKRMDQKRKEQDELTRLEKEASEERIKQIQREQELKYQAASVGLRGLSNLFAQGAAKNRQYARIAKGLAIADAVANTYVAANKALATYPPPFGGFAAAGVVAQGLVNVANIRAQKFADGGIVGGTSFGGDKVPAMLNSGEAVFNKRQQKNLWRIADGRAGVNNKSNVTFVGGEMNLTVGAGADESMVRRVVTEAMNQQNIAFAEMTRRNATFGVTA